MKLFERILDSRIREIFQLSENQCGFVAGCGTIDAIHAARLLVEKHSEIQKPQKGDASECSNYRGIKLISHTMKIYERLVDSRLREMVTISQEQRGFMPEKSITNAIFIARQVMEKYREKRKPCYMAFLDLEKAYDRLSQAVLCK
ncbi:unnamed protein product [Heligmosomoides polygyrus]|uniref:Reverse transcriptase domain-containing protein n=1 Tax=Heligmosomoides polygyrus TaxID=6339 RepID=A0A183GEQ7_HELPZ|nr:unnamed protein product [Heligmosomoides polygyrus]